MPDPILNFTPLTPAEQAETPYILQDGIDSALGQALRYRRQAAEYRKLAAECERQAAYWDGLVDQLRQDQPGTSPTTGMLWGPGGQR